MSWVTRRAVASEFRVRIPTLSFFPWVGLYILISIKKPTVPKEPSRCGLFSGEGVSFFIFLFFIFYFFIFLFFIFLMTSSPTHPSPLFSGLPPPTPPCFFFRLAHPFRRFSEDFRRGSEDFRRLLSTNPKPGKSSENLVSCSPYVSLMSFIDFFGAFG